MIRPALKSLSQRLGIYNFIRYSKVYEWLLKYKNPQYVRALNDDLAFYQSALGKSLQLVFDVGANRGDKAWSFRQIAKSVVCIEPDKSCFEALRARYGTSKSITLENVAVGDRTGHCMFFVEE